MIVAILGRQPHLGIAELERVYGSDAVSWWSGSTALINTDQFDVEKIGGTIKAGRVVAELPRGDWRAASLELVRAYEQAWADHDGKITLGLSAYGFPKLDARDVQKTGITLKQKLKKSGTSLRLIPNQDTALSSATSHHNKLGLSDNKVELIVVRAGTGKIVIAESCGAQNITALARRDQGRPKRDAFVGMLPPKLALQMINFAPVSEPSRILDPFCGTGVVLQEAALLGHDVYGTDLSAKMIDFSDINLAWLKESHRIDFNWQLFEADAMTASWDPPIDAVVCESYLGQPFSAPPSPAKLREVRGNCNRIVAAFLQNIHGQLEPGTPVCIAVPAWRDINGNFAHLPLTDDPTKLGYEAVTFKNVSPRDLLYYREDQVVARELLVLKRK